MTRSKPILVPLVLLIAGISCTKSEVPDVTLTAMSFNIRYANPSDGIHQWDNRKDWVAEITRNSNADVVGLQEALRHQIDTLLIRLPGYNWVGVGRDDGRDSGEFSPILFRPEVLTLLSTGTYWLSPSPGTIGSVGWDAALPRIVTWASFTVTDTGHLFFYFNTHFDHQGETARLESAQLIRRQIASIAGTSPYILSGDFNAIDTSPPYLALIREEANSPQLVDSRQAAIDSNLTTFRGFEVESTTPRTIDYVFFSPQFDILEHAVIDESRDNSYPSDHLPVLTTASLPSKK